MSQDAKKFSNREVAEEIARITGNPCDPSYVSAVRTGARVVRVMSQRIEQAIANLEARQDAVAA